MKQILVFVENYFDRVLTKPTLAEAKAFAEGAQCGVSYYGAGSFGVWIYPEDEEMMREMEKPEEIEKALKALQPEVVSTGC